jgi:hypothetical protein
VMSKDLSTGKQNKITITNDRGRLTKDDIERMVREADEFKVSVIIFYKLFQIYNNSRPTTMHNVNVSTLNMHWKHSHLTYAKHLNRRMSETRYCTICFITKHFSSPDTRRRS